MEVSSCPTLPLSWVPNCAVPNCPVSKCPVPSCPVSSCHGFEIGTLIIKIKGGGVGFQVTWSLHMGWVCEDTAPIQLLLALPEAGRVVLIALSLS